MTNESPPETDAPPRLYGLADAARALGVSRQRARKLYIGRRLPEPSGFVSRTPVWPADEFEAFAAERRVRLGLTPPGMDPDVAR